MKPDWKDAPKWANWLAQDGDRVWYWYENEPILGDWSFEPDEFGEVRRVYESTRNWQDSLEERPSKD